MCGRSGKLKTLLDVLSVYLSAKAVRGAKFIQQLKGRQGATLTMLIS